MEAEKKEIKEVKSYSLPPSQIAWLRQQAQRASTPEKTVSASAVLERIIEEAMTVKQSPTLTKSKKNAQTRELAMTEMVRV